MKREIAPAILNYCQRGPSTQPDSRHLAPVGLTAGRLNNDHFNLLLFFVPPRSIQFLFVEFIGNDGVPIEPAVDVYLKKPIRVALTFGEQKNSDKIIFLSVSL